MKFKPTSCGAIPFQGTFIPCDIDSDNNTCPDDYCCVRDDFLYTETYCKQYGRAGSACSTKPSEFECPCEPGLRCASNIHGHITSLFGKCYPLPDYTTDDSLDVVTSSNGNKGTDSTKMTNGELIGK